MGDCLVCFASQRTVTPTPVEKLPDTVSAEHPDVDVVPACGNCIEGGLDG